MLLRYLSVLYCYLMCYGLLHAQDDEVPLVSVSGIVYEEGLDFPVPFATVIVMGSSRGTISAANGFFSIVAHMGDTLRFSSVGYKHVLLPIPDTLQRTRVSVMVPMPTDTVMLAEAVVYPWPGREQFREAFLALEVQEPFTHRMMPIPGIRRIDNPIPLDPHPFWNPVSFVYDNVVLEMIRRMPKRRVARELPVFE
jgi:hypothetical protein